MFYAHIMSIATCFIHTSYHFYAFSGTNLLTRCHSASCLFSTVFGFRKVVKEIFSELDETKTQSPIFPDTFTKTKGESEEGTGVPTPCGGAGPPPGAAPCGVEPSGLHRPCPFDHKYLFTGKP